MVTNSSLLQDVGPAAAPQVLEPVLSLPMRSSVDGSLGHTTIDFGEPCTTLHLVEQVDDGWVSTVIWHSPTVAAATLVVAPVVVLAVVVRAARRRQVFGHYYCVRCNYDLTGPGGMPPEAVPGSRTVKCAECGCELKEKPARLGRSMASRVWKSVLVAVVLIAACLGTLVATLERANPTNVWKPGWMDLVSRTGMTPRLVRVFNGFDRARLCVSTWSLPDGRRTRHAEIGEQHAWMAVTKDSEWCAWMENDGMSASLHAMNLRTEQRVEPSLPTRGPWSIVYISPSERPGHVMVQYTNAVQQPGAANEAMVARVDLASGNSTVVGRVGSLAANQAGGGGKFFIRERGEEVTWAYVTYGSSSGGTLTGSVFNSRLDEFKFEFAGSTWTEPVLTSDGLAIELASLATRGLPGGALRVSLVDGTQTASTVAASYPTSKASNESTVSWTGGFQAVVQTPQLEVRGPDRNLLAVLSVGKATPYWPVISRDGRWVAAAMTTQRTTWTGAIAVDGEVYVWDLHQLKRPE